METVLIKIANHLRKLYLKVRPKRRRQLMDQLGLLAHKPKLRVFERREMRRLNKMLGNQNPYPIHGVAANLRMIRLAEKVLSEW